MLGLRFGIGFVGAAAIRGRKRDADAERDGLEAVGLELEGVRGGSAFGFVGKGERRGDMFV